MAYNLPVSNYRPPAFGNGGSSQNAINLLLQLVGQSSAGRDEARQANESRYNDILELLGSLRGRTLDDLQNMGQQQIADTNESYDNKRKELITDLADRGLSGSTKRIAVESMTKRERDAAVNRIKDALVANRTAADERLTTNATGVMERRSDPYPDTSNIGAIVTQLAGLLGRGGSNAGGSSGRGKLPGQQIPAVPGYTYDVKQGKYKPTAETIYANQAATRAAQNAAYDERQRRAAMGGLQTAIETGGLEGEDRVRSALAFLQANGWATQNPNTVSTAPFSQPAPAYGAYAPAGVYEQPYAIGGYQRVPLRQRDPVFASIVNNDFMPAQENRIAGYKTARKKYIGSNDYQDAIRRLQAAGIGMRQNPAYAGF
jgi:hypothetical protein